MIRARGPAAGVASVAGPRRRHSLGAGANTTRAIATSLGSLCALGLGASVSLALRPRRPVVRAPRVATAAIAAPAVLQTARRIAVRTLPAWLAAAVRSFSTRGVSPAVVVLLVAYSLAVTIYAARKAIAAEAAASAAASAAATDAIVDASLGTNTQSAALSSGEAPAAAVASVLAPPGPATAASALLQPPTSDGRVVCKICGGSGVVSLTEHEREGESVCPCCLGKGRVKNRTGGLLSALLSFDP